MYTWYRDTPSPLVTSVHSPVKNELMSFFKSFFFFLHGLQLPYGIKFTGFIAFLAPFSSLDATWVICLGSAISSPSPRVSMPSCGRPGQARPCHANARPSHMVSLWLKARQQSCFGWTNKKSASPNVKLLGLERTHSLFGCMVCWPDLSKHYSEE